LEGFTMSDRTAVLAAFLRENRRDRGEVLAEIFTRWPDLTADELDRVINHCRRPLLALPDRSVKADPA
jgi:hypothetical protein